MAINARDVPNTGGKAPDPIESGSYPARLVQIIDLGVQPQEYNGEEKPPKREILTTYELLDEFMKDEDGNELTDKPRWISESFPLNSLNSERAKSTKRYYALDPVEEYNGDWGALLGTPCSITIVQNYNDKKKRTYNNIANVSAMRPRDAEKAPELVNEAKFFDLDNPDLSLFNSLPDWIKEKITSGLEFNGGVLDKLLQSKDTKKETKSKSDNKAPVEVEEDEEDGVMY